MKKRMYEKPKMELVLFEAEDVITGSWETDPVPGGQSLDEYDLFNINND